MRIERSKQQAAEHQDADAVLLTGFSHAPNPVGLGALFASLVPASTERRFTGRDPGYLTTRPGTRQVLYGRSDVTPQVAAYDEDTKDVVSAAEVPGAVVTTLWAALSADERPYFGHSPAFEARTIAGSGHDLNLSTTTPQLHAVVLDWARRTVPR
jgi:hypothetical protein